MLNFSDCVSEMQRKSLSNRLCDGVIDCQDVSDEKSCTYCPSGYLHCGIGRTCIPQHHRCDGKNDCPDGSDERACRKYQLSSPRSICFATQTNEKLHVYLNTCSNIYDGLLSFIYHRCTQ